MFERLGYYNMIYSPKGKYRLILQPSTDFVEPYENENGIRIEIGYYRKLIIKYNKFNGKRLPITFEELKAINKKIKEIGD